MRALAFLVCLTPLACTTVERIPGPDGEMHLSIECGYVKDCYKQAAESCPGGYTVADKSSETVGLPNVGVTENHTMLVKCK